MKTMILTGTVILTLAGASLQSARAGDREWATVGKVLTGVAVAGIIVAASDGHVQGSVSYSSGSPAYCPPPPPCHYYPAPPPVVYCPPPVVVVPPCAYPARTVVVYHPNKWNNHQRWHARHNRW